MSNTVVTTGTSISSLSEIDLHPGTDLLCDVTSPSLAPAAPPQPDTKPATKPSTPTTKPGREFTPFQPPAPEKQPKRPPGRDDDDDFDVCRGPSLAHCLR